MWQKLEKGSEPSPEQCLQGDHAWVAFFFEGGCLAYWRCEGCGETDREIEPATERLASINGWIEDPPRLIARGSKPPVSRRRWGTPKGTLLAEGDPSSIHHVGVAIPGLAEAHAYVERSQDGEVVAVYEPFRERLGPYSDHYWLTRYQVVGETLVRFQSHCYEESTYDVPNAGKPKQKAIISGLRLLPD